MWGRMSHVLCVCSWDQQRERWHIRPEGTSLLESLPPPHFISTSLSPYSSLPDSPRPITGAVEGRTEPAVVQKLPYGATQFLHSNYSMIQCNIPLQIFPHKFISQPIKDTAGEIIYIAVSQYNTARCRLLRRRQMWQVPPVERQPGRH